MRPLALILLAVLATACPTKRDYGLGECTEYKPVCFTGPMRCVTDDRGCEVCTCDEGKQPPYDAP